MNLDGARILLTGATGGIGRELAAQLTRHGAKLVLVGRNREALAALCAETGAQALSFDFDRDETYEELVADAVQRLGGIDVLINNAGKSSFGAFDTQDSARVQRMLRVNLLAPVLLTQAVLPHLREGARIVNVGSVFGAIAFPYHAVYSATKFGLRGFSEALRRETEERGIGITYVAPRATRTAMNSRAMYLFAEKAGMTFDSPGQVAAAIIGAVEQDKAEHTIGAPERFFGRLNAWFPRFVDRALRKQTRSAREALRVSDTLLLR